MSTPAPVSPPAPATEFLEAAGGPVDRLRRPRHQDRLVFGLTVACPLARAHRCSCPLEEIRRRPLAQRALWIASQPAERLQEILDQHRTCFTRSRATAARTA